MAGMEQLEIHSKSYMLRWINVAEGHSISWSIQPHKKSINFGIFKHPGTKAGTTPVLPTSETVDTSTSISAPPTLNLDADGHIKKSRRGSLVRNDSIQLVEKLGGLGMQSVAWTGKCDADKVSLGRYDVPDGEGGTYGLVFDNTFSKQVSKTATFVLLTHPTNAPPTSGHHLHHSQAFAGSSTSDGTKASPTHKPVSDSTDSLPSDPSLHRAVLEDPRPRSKRGRGVETKDLEGATFYTGVLHKKRRKRAQLYARRFFSLDFTSSTLSYYRNRHSSGLRGAIPLSLAAIGVNEKAREFSVDSGAEVWHLKASNRKDFDGWRNALERASNNTIATPTLGTPAKLLASLPPPSMPNLAEEREWERAEQLIGRVSGTRDAVRCLAKDTDPKYISGMNGAGLGLTISGGSSNTPSPSESGNPYFQDAEVGNEKRPFWKRKPSSSRDRSPAGLLRRTVSAQFAVSSPSAVPLKPVMPSPGTLTIPKRGRSQTPQIAQVQDEEVHDRCMALLKDLDAVVADFSALLNESKMRRMPPLSTTGSRLSLDSTSSQEFFDAEDGVKSPSQLLSLRRSSDFAEAREKDSDEMFDAGDSDASTDADGTVDEPSLLQQTSVTARSALFPTKSRTLTPLPLPPVRRRTTVVPPKQSPPSIIGFLRKNAGKDLSTVSMPVTANEPTSLLQRLAENLEYSQLLDSAAAANAPAERLMYVAAFAISGFACNRVKERAIRKPFNPMLGETYELVREDLGFRFVAEKISHHPVRMACQADSLTNGGWSFSQSPQPVQKFWGKSVELNTEGRARITLHAANEGKGEHYSWNQATCFLRNVIAGEKYVEPVQSMTVVCETTGQRAVATFKAGGMFSGRGEDVTVHLLDLATGDSPLSIGLHGKWTESLKRSDTGAVVWTVGSLVPDAPKVYGFTTFAATLNQITAIEEGRLPPTDSRLRPDQQAFESGDADHAEALKARLEERQRSRRKVLESHDQAWTPQWFERVGEGAEEEVWVLRDNRGYWDCRETADWKLAKEVFEL